MRNIKVITQHSR